MLLAGATICIRAAMCAALRVVGNLTLLTNMGMPVMNALPVSGMIIQPRLIPDDNVDVRQPVSALGTTFDELGQPLSGRECGSLTDCPHVPVAPVTAFLGVW